MKYLAIIFKISTIAFFICLMLTLFNDGQYQKYLFSAACIVTAALSIKYVTAPRQIKP